MDEYESLSHSKWECKYHVVFIPKCRRKTLYGELRRHLGDVFRKLAQQKESRIEEGHLMPDHVHMMISIPPKYAVSQVVGFIKGKRKCDPFGACIRREETQFCRAAFLGERVLRLDRRSGRSGDTGVHQKPGAGRQPLGANEFVALIGHLQVANKCRIALATLTAASSGPIPKAPGSAGGYLPQHLS
jgi:REP element-mobilizing transposase RayT